MPWKKIETKELAKRLNVDYETIEVKQDLIDKIKKTRKKYDLTQQDLAKALGKSQSWLAKVESGIGTRNVSFELLFKILGVLGYHCKVTTKKVSEPEDLAA